MINMNYTSRPLSPHLSIYQIQQRSTVSIANRITTLIIIFILFSVILIVKTPLFLVNSWVNFFLFYTLLFLFILNFFIHIFLSYSH